MSVLKVVVARERFGDVVARIELRAVQGFDETNCVFVDDSRVEEPDIEQTRFRFAGPSIGPDCVRMR